MAAVDGIRGRRRKLKQGGFATFQVRRDPATTENVAGRGNRLIWRTVSRELKSKEYNAAAIETFVWGKIIDEDNRIGRRANTIRFCSPPFRLLNSSAP
jgi:hypothetical protein